MKKTLGLILVALLAVGLVGGYTLAYFSDTETSEDNTWTAGTLNLVNVISGTPEAASTVVTEQDDGLNDKVVFSSVVPGSSGTITWTLSNTGNVAGTLTMVAATTFTEGGDPEEPELTADPTNLIGLGQSLMVWVTRGGTDILGTTGTYVAMSGLAAALSAESQSMAGGASLVYVLHWEVPTTVGNEIQGDTAELDITFTLTQS
jgi:predicted ribosomally synthesized peptide with SipW-like signal peptide